MENRFVCFFKKITYLQSSWSFYAVTSYIWFSPLALSKPTLKVKLIQSKPRIWLNSITQETAKPQRIFRHEAPAHSPVLQSPGMHSDCSTTLKSPERADGSWLQPSLLKHFFPSLVSSPPCPAHPWAMSPGVGFSWLPCSPSPWSSLPNRIMQEDGQTSWGLMLCKHSLFLLCKNNSGPQALLLAKPNTWPDSMVWLLWCFFCLFVCY